jgi:Protein of unknown function (DUF2842)
MFCLFVAFSSRQIWCFRKTRLCLTRAASRRGFSLRGKPSRVLAICLLSQIHYLGRFAMPIRLKKFIGMILLVALVIIYAVVAVMIASAQLAQSHWLTHLAYFTFSGLLWIVPAMVIIKWMAGPLPGKN